MPPADAIALAAAAVVGGYLIGSVPVALWVGRRRAGLDLREVGDRNPGWWNAKEQLGRAAWPVLVLDAAKGAASAALGWAAAADGRWGVAWAAAGAAMVGHAFPVFARFRGGRSVLCFAGAACVLSPLAAAAAIAVLLVVWGATRSFAWGARAGVAAFPVAELVVDGPHRTAATGALMTFIGVRFVQAAVASRRRGRGGAAAAGG